MKKPILPESKWIPSNKSEIGKPKVKMPENQWAAVDNKPQSKVGVKLPTTSWDSMGVHAPIQVTGFKGETTLDSLMIDKNYATRTKNLTGAGFPALEVRPGMSLVGSFGSRVLGMGTWKDTELHGIGSGTSTATWYKWDGNTFYTLTPGLSNTAQWTFCNFQGAYTGVNLLCSNGVDPVKRYDGTNVLNVNNAPANAKYISQHDNRVYVAVGNSVKHSALRNAEDWTSAGDAGSGELVVETGNGELINGLSAGNRHLMVFKPNSVHELWGNGPANYQMDLIAADIGLLSNQSLVSIQGTPYWMDARGAYYYNGGRPRTDFFLPMKTYFDSINQANKHKATAGTDGRNLYLSIPTGLNTEPDTVLEYNTQFQVWYTWKDLSVLYFSNLGANWYAGNSNGILMKMGGSTNNLGGSAVAWEWVSAPFGGGGSLAERLQWYRMWYVADVPIGSTMNVYLSRDAEGENWTLVKAVVANNLQSGRVIIPVETVANSNWVRVRFTGTGPAKITEFDYQQRELPMY